MRTDLKKEILYGNLKKGKKKQMEFKSKLEETLPAEELNFEPTPGFKGHYESYLDHSIAHPAKMSLNLLEFLISTYTKENDVVLDPMAGTGSTGVVASLKGRDAVLVELEDKFVGWINVAKGKVDRQNALSNKGSLVVLKGDARQLSNLLGIADTIITSPPYSGSVKGEVGVDWTKCKKESGVFRDRTKEPAFNHLAMLGSDFNYSNDPSNIGNLKHGNIDAVITSPPYEGQDLVMSGRKQMAERLTKAGYNEAEIKHHLSNAMSRNGNDTRDRYSESLTNIGNTKGETYLDAMFRVYSEMFKVLKQGGLAVIVIKPFIRNKQVIDLPFQTWHLMEKAGFKLKQVYKLRLKNASFWRILYSKKYPSVQKISHEYIIVAQKS